MPYNNNNVKHVLPPVNQNSGSRNRQNGTSNHGVFLPPIQDNNKVTNSNNVNDDDRRQQNVSNQTNQYQRQEPINNAYNDNNKKQYYEPEADRHTERNERQNRHKHSRSRSKSGDRSRDKNSKNRSRSKSPTMHNERSNEKSYKSNDRRSRSRSRKSERQKSSYTRQKRSSSRNRDSRRRSKSHERRRRSKSHESRRRSKSRNDDRRQRNQSHNHRSRQRSKSRSSSRHKHRTRHGSRSRSKSRNTKSKSHRHKSRSKSRESRRRNEYRYHRKSDRHSSRSLSRDYDDKKYRNKSRHTTVDTRKSHSDSYRGSKSHKHKQSRSSRSSSSEYRKERRQKESKRTSRHSNSKHYQAESNNDSSDSDNERQYKSDDRLFRAKKETRLKSKSKLTKHRSRRDSISDSEPSQKKNYNVIVLENGQDYSSSGEEYQPSKRAVYIRSKSQHAVRLKAKRRKSKEYYSDIDTRQGRNRNVIYYDEEPEEIIVTPRNTLGVQRRVRHINTINNGQNTQPEEEGLFYLVPATNQKIDNQQNQESAIFVNQSGGRVVRMSHPSTQNNAKEQIYYVNKNDAVYGQEPLYDEYRQPVQQKFYNQHTNHYRHEVNVPDNNIVNIIPVETVSGLQSYRTNENSLNNQEHVVVNINRTVPNADLNQNNTMAKSNIIGNSNLTTHIAPTSGRTPDGQSASSVGQSSTTSESRMSAMEDAEYRPTTAERKKALKHLNELSNYNIDVAMGKASLNSPPMTDETLIKKIFNAEFQSQMDDYLRS